jgi:DNA repair protein RadC
LHKIGNLLFNFDLQAEEVFSIVTLDTKNNVTGAFEVSRGALNGSIVHPREVFKRAILQNASSIALMHNHPSGDPKPSSEDLQMTKRLEEAGKILGISILDHIIFGDYFFSFKEEGLI